MIGPALFDISYEIYLTMLGLIWMLVDSVYHFIRPLERSGDNVSATLTEKCEKNEQFVLKSNELVNQTSEENLVETESDLSFKCESYEAEGSRVHTDIISLSTHKNTFFGATNASIDRRFLPKRSQDSLCDVHSKSLDSNYQKALNLVVVKNTFNKKHELNSNLLLSIREITKFINKSTTADGNQTSLVPLSQDSNGGNISFGFSEANLQVGIDIQRKKSNWSLFPPSGTIFGKRIKLDNDQILALQETALYIINHLGTEDKSQFRKIIYQLESLDFIYTKWNYSGSVNNQTDFEKTPNVKITEIDSGDEIELMKKSKNQRKKKTKKRYRKEKLVNQKIEPNLITFSSKQCFERLTYFMSTNQGLTQSKVMLEIQKEFKPIKDQISELRESMTDFVVVSQRTFEKGIRSSKLFVKHKKDHKLKSIFTVSSASLQRLARLADTSTNNQESSCQEGTDEPKKLSPLAEMYIKLSRQ